MSGAEMSLQESDARRLEQIRAAEEKVLRVYTDSAPSTPSELQQALADANIGVEQSLIRTAVLRLLNDGRLTFGGRTATAH